MSSQVKPIPEGFRTITPSIFVKDGAKAIEFYKNALGAEEIFRSAAPDGRIMHAEIKVGDSKFFLNDEFPEFAGQCQTEYPSGSPITIGGRSGSLYLYVENADEWFDRAIAAGAQSVMPMEDAFWGDHFGMVVDPFGHVWAFATHVKDVTPEEFAKVSAEIFSGPEGQAAGAE